MKDHRRRVNRVQKSVIAPSANDSLRDFEEFTHFFPLIKLFDMKEKWQCFLIFSGARSYKDRAVAKSTFNCFSINPL